MVSFPKEEIFSFWMKRSRSSKRRSSFLPKGEPLLLEEGQLILLLLLEEGCLLLDENLPLPFCSGRLLRKSGHLLLKEEDTHLLEEDTFFWGKEIVSIWTRIFESGRSRDKVGMNLSWDEVGTKLGRSWHGNCEDGTKMEI